MNRLLATLALALATLASTTVRADEPTYPFGVIIHRSPTLTAQFWNPILKYVSERTNMQLELSVARTGAEHTEMVRKGAFSFLFSNHNFIGEANSVGYRVFARPQEEAGKGVIVVLESSPVRTLDALRGQDVVFPHKAAFLGYHLTMDALQRRDIPVNVIFAGNQEGALGQLVAGRAPAAGLSADILTSAARRLEVKYRVLWTSEPYLNLALSAHPSVPQPKVNAVRDAFLKMAADPEGAKVLKGVAEVVKSEKPLAFVAARDADFDNMRHFYKTTKVPFGL